MASKLLSWSWVVKDLGAGVSKFQVVAATAASTAASAAAAAAAAAGPSSDSGAESAGSAPQRPSAATWATVLSFAKLPRFRTSLTEQLVNSEHGAFFFECNPVRWDTLAATPFEFVLLPAPELERVVRADSAPFRQYLSQAQAAGKLTTDFLNMGSDGVMVVPSGLGKPLTAGAKRVKNAHLASFLRNSDSAEIDAFWKHVFQALSSELKERRSDRSDDPHQWTWLSTHGGGVSWLHMRIDSRPKYYHYGPYRKRPTAPPVVDLQLPPDRKLEGCGADVGVGASSSSTGGCAPE